MANMELERVSGEEGGRVSRMVLLVCLSVPFFSSCTNDRQPPREQRESAVELIYWPAPNPQEVQLADTLVRSWNRTHPGIQVRMQPIPVSQSTEEVLLAAIAGKTTPDVCSNINPIAMREYTQAGGLVPLDTFSGFDTLSSSRVPSALLETFRADDGHFYQFPWKTNPLMMYYNVRLFEEAGIHGVPRAYSEYYAAGERVSRDTSGDGQIDIWMGERDIRPIWWQRLFDFYPFYIAASRGGTLFSNDSIAFANALAEQVFAFFQTCYERQYFPRTYFQAGDPFLLEKKATHFAGPWEVAALQKYAPSIRYGVAPLPVPDGTEGPVHTFGDYKSIGIFSTTRHPREAWEFVRYLVTAEHDLLLLQICDQLPVRGDLLDHPLFAGYFRQKPMMGKFAQQVPYTRGADMVPDLKEIFDAIAQQYEVCAVYGQKSAAEAVRDAAEQTRAILQWNQ